MQIEDGIAPRHAANNKSNCGAERIERDVSGASAFDNKILFL